MLRANLMLYVTGSKVSFYCEVCGCNVFCETAPKTYQCNGCGAQYTSEVLS